MPTSISSSGITFDDATTQTTSATKTGGIGTAQLATDAVTTAKIADANVTAAKLASNSVTSAKLDSVGGGAGNPPVYGCRAWVNFDGTKDTTGATSTANTNRLIRASGNVTSVLRNGTSDYTITFTTSMPDANYVVNGNIGDWAPINGARVVAISSAAAPTTTAVRIAVTNGNSEDQPRMMISIFR